MKVRTLLSVLVPLLIIGCNLARHRPGNDQTVVGKWEIVHMSKTPAPVDNLPASKLARARMEFKSDGKFAGTVSMPGAPEGMSMSGTYQVDGDVITINNGLNKSTTKSKMRFEKDYLVLEPITQDPFSYSMYYKRAR